ncbi:hypothetical protein [Nocardioides sp. 503]|uniref:hypothetical protein n=1 Tax=Nocardioides sp. 503 TaxID=2508326 RepID=UPI00106F949E|nr:hypothetical protein [Nocardioides sp. 503]
MSGSRSASAPLVAGEVLARGWLRTPASRRSLTVVTLVFAIFAAVVICVSAFLPTSEQLAEKEFGRYDAGVFANVDVGDLDAGGTSRIQDRVRAVAPGAHVLIETDALRPDHLAKRFVQAPLSVLRYAEDPNLREAFPGRYTLQDGRWPSAPGEVAVSPELLESLGDPDSFTVLSGRVSFDLVGVVEDAFAKKDDTIVAAPGTWESIPPARPGRAAGPTEAKLRVLVEDTSTVPAISDLLAEALPPLPKEQGDRSGYIQESRQTRDDVARRDVPTFGADEAVVSYLPLLLLVLVVSSLVVAQVRPATRRTANRLTAVGVRRVWVTAPHLLVIAATMTLAVTVGLVLGWLAALALRATVLPGLAEQTLSPVPRLDRTTVAVAAMCVVLVAAGTSWPEPTSERGRLTAVRRALSGLRLGLLRRVAVVLLGVGALQVGSSRATSVRASYLALAAVILVTPDLLRIVVRTMPRRSPRWWVARRLIESDVSRQALAAGVVACCIAVPVLVATQLASQKASDATFTFSRVPAGQIWVQSDSGAGDVTGAADAIRSVPGIGRPVAIRGLRSEDDTLAAFFTRAPAAGRTSLNIMVVDTVADVRRVIGDEVSATGEATLEDGGVLDFTGAGGRQRLEVISPTGARALRTAPLPTLGVALPIALRANFGGAILRASAEDLGLPVSAPSRYVFADVSPHVTAEAAAAAVAAGYDGNFVQYAVEPPEPTLPTTAYVFLAALVLGGFAVLVTIIRAQGRRVRSYLARLVALGLGTRWAVSLLGIQAALIVAVGVVAGVGAGVLGIRVASATYAVTLVPAVPIAIACAATAVAALLATGSAVRTVTAVEGAEVG